VKQNARNHGGFHDILESSELVRRWTPLDDRRLTTIQMTSQYQEGMRSLLAEWLRTVQRDARRASSGIV
jgi:hypothetical protein